MLNVEGNGTESTNRSSTGNSKCSDNLQSIEHVIVQMGLILRQLDLMGFPRAATYLSMAIDQVEVDFTTESK